MKFIFLIIFFLFSFLPQVLAEETQTIEVEYNINQKLDFSDVKSIELSDPKVAEVKIVDGEIFVKGRKKGSSILYVWQKDKISDLIIKVKDLKINQKTTFQKKVMLLPPNNLNGSYQIQNYFSNGKDFLSQDKQINHVFFLNIPLEDNRKIDINASMLNSFAGNDFSPKSLSFPNLNAVYKDKTFSVELGDSFFYSPLGSFNSFIAGGIKGLKISNDSSELKYNLFTGFERSPLLIFNSTEQPPSYQSNSYLVGGNGEYNTGINNLNILSSFISKFDLSEDKKHYFNYSAGLNWKPQKNLSLDSFLGTSFNGFGGLLKVNYKYDWEKTAEWINLDILSQNFGNNYFETGSKSFNFHTLKFDSYHKSGLKLSGNFAFSLNDQVFNRNNWGLKLSRSFGKINLFSQLLFLDMESYKRKTFSLGSNINFIFPLSFYYNYTDNNYKNDLQDKINNYHQFRLFLNIFKSKTLNLNLSSSTFLLNDNNSNNFRQNLRLNFTSVLNRDILLKLLMDYSFDLNQQDSKFKSDSFRLTIGSDYKFSAYHKISLSLNYFSPVLVKTFSEGFNSQLSYTYNFGMNYLDLSGDINGFVFEDENDNGIREPEEKILDGVKLTLANKEIMSGKDGFSFKNVDYGLHEIRLEQKSLPPKYQNSSLSAKTLKLDKKKTEINFPVSKKCIIHGTIFGNKSFSSFLSNIELIVDEKEKTTSAFDGSYSFKVMPGHHNIRINYETIPVGYYLKGQLIRDFEIAEKENKFDFILQPIISLRGTVISKETGKPESNFELIFKKESDEEVEEIKVKTDSKGEFTLNEINDGVWEISNNKNDEITEIEIFPKPGEVKITIRI